MKKNKRETRTTVAQELEGGRVMRLVAIGKQVYSEILANGRVLQRKPVGRIEANTLTLGVFSTKPGDAIKRPPKPCPECGAPMEHQPDECTNLLPNGTFRCPQCGLRWFGEIGIIDDVPN
jgi:hypothetical protein